VLRLGRDNLDKTCDPKENESIGREFHPSWTLP
jgi:hypothetical protein